MCQLRRNARAALCRRQRSLLVVTNLQLGVTLRKFGQWPSLAPFALNGQKRHKALRQLAQLKQFGRIRGVADLLQEGDAHAVTQSIQQLLRNVLATRWVGTRLPRRKDRRKNALVRSWNGDARHQIVLEANQPGTQLLNPAAQHGRGRTEVARLVVKRVLR